PSGACCNGTACTQTLNGQCGFTYSGDNTTCFPNACFLADDCAVTDLVASLGSQAGSNVDATTSFNIQPGSLCPGILANGTGGNNDVFWKFTAPATTDYTLDT